MIAPNRATTLLEIAERIAEERNRLGMSQEELGRATHSHRNTVRHYETGVRKPDPLFLASFENLGADVAYVLTGKRRIPQSKAIQALVGDVLPESVADMVLAVAGQKRSEAYRRGLVDMLAYHMQECRSELPFELGSPEFDAYLAGNERGHLVWAVMVEG